MDTDSSTAATALIQQRTLNQPNPTGQPPSTSPKHVPHQSMSPNSSPIKRPQLALISDARQQQQQSQHQQQQLLRSFNGVQPDDQSASVGRTIQPSPQHQQSTQALNHNSQSPLHNSSRNPQPSPAHQINVNGNNAQEYPNPHLLYRHIVNRPDPLAEPSKEPQTKVAQSLAASGSLPAATSPPTVAESKSTPVDTPGFSPQNRVNGIPSPNVPGSDSLMNEVRPMPISAPPPVPATRTAIPRSLSTAPRPSGIPRLCSATVPPQSPPPPPLHELTNSNNNANACRNGTSLCSPSFENLPYENGTSSSIPATPSSACSMSRYQPFSPPMRSATESSDDTNNNQNNNNKSYIRQYATGRSRAPTRSYVGRYDRAVSEHPLRTTDNESDTSSVFSSSGTPRIITSKVNSFKNVHYKPGGGNVKIVDEKLEVGPIKSKCNSFANVKHRPGGGHVEIINEKIDFSQAHSKVQSLKNVKHVPAGGQVQILSEKLDFDKKAKSKVGSLANAHHNPGGGDVKIFSEALPWLKYNRPNLPPEERERINKHLPGSHSDMTSSHSSSMGH